MIVRIRLWIARLLRKIAYRLGNDLYSPSEIKDILEAVFFSCYFPKEVFPDGPPPSLKTTRNLYRRRVLKGINNGRTAIVRKDNKLSSDRLEVWIEDGPTPVLPKRNEWGDPNNTTEKLIERGVLEDYKEALDKILEPIPRNEKAI